MNGPDFIESLGWVLIHSLWQFALVALLAGMVTWSLRHRTANLRYGVLVMLLALIAIAPVVTWCVLPAATHTPIISEATPPQITTATTPVPQLEVTADVAIAPSTSPPTIPSPVSAELPTSPPPVPAAVVVERSWTEALAESLRPWMAWIVAIWSLGVVLCSLRPLLGWLTLRRLRTVGVLAVNDDITAMLCRIAERLGLRKAVTVLQSTWCHTPMVLGYFRPVILLPVSLITSIPPAQLEAILAHELAHIRRHDFVVNLLQTLLETLGFYHPAVWWLSRQIRVEREHCCDDLVIAAFNNRAEYGRALLAVEQLRGPRTVLALSATDGSLLSRIRRIVGLRTDLPASSPWSMIVVTASALIAIGVSFALVNHPDVRADDNNTIVQQEPKSAENDTTEALPAIVTWPGEKSLEFVGITKNTAAVKEGWQPNGAPIGDVPNWKSTIVLHSGNTPGNFATSTYIEGQLKHQPDAEAIDFLFRFRGLKAQPSLTFDLPANGSNYSHWPVADPYELRVSARKRGPEPPGGKWSPPDGILRVSVTDEPWGRWVKITPEGVVPEPVQPDELYASTYRLIEVRGAVSHERSPLGKAIQIHEPASNRDPEDEWHRYSFEFRAVDTEGKDHWALPWESQGEGDSKWVNANYAVANSFPKDKTLSHYEYRVRPYRHWAIFENVSLEPGTRTMVKVSTRTWPTKPTRVKVSDVRGQPATFNMLTTAHVGYPAKPFHGWLGWRDKAGLVSLEELPFGKHWIVAAGEFEQRSVFPLTHSAGQKDLEWRLRGSEPWTKHDLEFKPRFEPNEKTGGAIVVTVKNKFDKPLTLTEADFSLHVGETATYRVMTPQWADQQFAPVEIAAGQAGEIRLNWNEWVRKGFWMSRNGEAISEPTLPPDEPGRIYVRVNLGNHGALPIAVTAPALILADNVPKADTQAKVEQPVEFRGSVRDAQQRPVTRATIALSVVSGGDYERREHTVATTVADESGAFTLSVAPSLLKRDDARARLHLWAWGPDVASQGMIVVPIITPTDEPYLLSLLPPTTERVRLVDERGQSIQAVVEQLSLSMGFDLVLPDDLAKQVLSQREINGDFELRGFPAGDEGHHSVWVRSLERGRLHCQWRPEPKTATTTLIWRDPVTIRGRLKAAHGELPAEVIQQAEVTLTTHGDDSPQRISWNVGHTKVRCDREGRFEATNLPPGSLQTEVHLPGLSGWKRLNPRDAAGNSLKVEAGKDVDIDLVMTRTRRLQGRIVDHQVKPLPGIELNLSHGQLQREIRTDGGINTSSDQLEVVRTDANGDFSLDITPGLVSVTKQYEPGSNLGTAIRWPATEKFIRPDGTLNIEPGDAPFVLPPVVIVTLSGRVIDHDERPFKGIAIASRGSPSEVTGMAECDDEGGFRLQTLWEPERFKVLPHDAFNTLPPKDPDTETTVVTRDPLVLQVVPKKGNKADPSQDERTSLLESLIKEPKLETLQKLLALAEGKHAEPTELLDDSRRHSGKEKMGGEVRVISNGKERFAIVSAKVIPLIEPSDEAVVINPDRRAECAFVFDMQGRLIDTLGGKLSGGNSLGGDDIHIVNLGPEEDWFVRVMSFEKRGELTYRSDYYRLANPVVKSFRFINLPNSCAWSNGPEKIPRHGRLYPTHPKAQRPLFAGVPRDIPVTTTAGFPTLAEIIWDGDRNRWIAAPKAFVKGLPLYEVDTQWSQEFEPLEPPAGELVMAGGAREFDHWHSWEASVPQEHRASVVLTIPQRGGPAQVIERELKPGRHIVQLQTKPLDNSPSVRLKLWIDDDHKEEFDLPFAFGEPFANSQPILYRLGLADTTADGVKIKMSAMNLFVVQRLLKETTDSLRFDIKLQTRTETDAKADDKPATTGKLTGRFVYDGEPPPPRELAPDLVKLTAEAELPRDQNGRVSGVAMIYRDSLRQGIRPRTTDPSLLVDAKGGIANVVVWVTSPKIPYVPKDREQGPALLSVIKGQYEPHVLWMQAGQTLEVTNQDPVPFNFHVGWIKNPATNQLVNPLSKKDPLRYTVQQPETAPIKYWSDLQPWASGYLVVRDNPYVAVSQPDGTFTLPDLPPGEWEFRVWHERRGYVEHWPKGKFTRTIAPGDNHLGDIRLKPELFAETKPNPAN